MRAVKHFFLAIMAAWTLFPAFASAQQDISTGFSSILQEGIIFANICPDSDPATGDQCEDCRQDGKCSIVQGVQVFLNVFIFLLGVSGTIALGMFFVGGLDWVLSRGDEGKVKRGKDTMLNAVIGLVIVFGAYAIVNFLVATLAGKAPGATLEDTIKSINGDTSLFETSPTN